MIIESAAANTGQIYVADSELKATSTNRHTLFEAGDYMVISGANFADLDGKINLRELWVHGAVVSERIVISYMDISEKKS